MNIHLSLWSFLVNPSWSSHGFSELNRKGRQANFESEENLGIIYRKDPTHFSDFLINHCGHIIFYFLLPFPLDIFVFISILLIHKFVDFNELILFLRLSSDNGHRMATLSFWGVNLKGYAHELCNSFVISLHLNQIVSDPIFCDLEHEREDRNQFDHFFKTRWWCCYFELGR